MPSSKTRRKKRSQMALTKAMSALPTKSFGANPVSAALGALSALGMQVEGKSSHPTVKSKKKKIVALTGSEQKAGLVKSLRGNAPSRVSYGRKYDAAQCSKFRALAYEWLGQLQSGEGLRPPTGVRTGLDFTAAGMPQRDVDRSFRSGVRVVVADIDGGPTATDAVVIGAGGSGGAATTAALVVLNATGSAAGNNRFTPKALSTLLSTIGQPWQYYAIRYYLGRFIPVASVFQVSTANPPLLQAPNATVAIGINEDPDSVTSGGLSASFQGVAELDTSVVQQVTKPCELEYCHTGNQIWANSTAETEADVDIQGTLVARFDATMAISTASTAVVPLMHHQAFAIVDYYGIRQVTQNDEVSGALRRLRAAGATVSEDEKGLLTVLVPAEVARRLRAEAAPSQTPKPIDDYVRVPALVRDPVTRGAGGPVWK